MGGCSHRLQRHATHRTCRNARPTWGQHTRPAGACTGQALARAVTITATPQAPSLTTSVRNVDTASAGLGLHLLTAPPAPYRATAAAHPPTPPYYPHPRHAPRNRNARAAANSTPTCRRSAAGMAPPLARRRLHKPLVARPLLAAGDLARRRVDRKPPRRRVQPLPSQRSCASPPLRSALIAGGRRRIIHRADALSVGWADRVVTRTAAEPDAHRVAVTDNGVTPATRKLVSQGSEQKVPLAKTQFGIHAVRRRRLLGTRRLRSDSRCRTWSAPPLHRRLFPC
ncbi:hypothetical protein BU14_0652s0003 [Porphyra umbilicalis]|uniref:Uncharacterized protein n=1 Tax=Porphyra umbilicalis TaxID=2786 RepID=A0A1X6NQI1_PORUM|nr:hypothetical protein BU14_0652s0003 [Porphyra umbilicalis]|eukprot:OSX70837.1 hypothetical protein BU14_0652s0003 [Porphyra umbilicalis]